MPPPHAGNNGPPVVALTWGSLARLSLREHPLHAENCLASGGTVQQLQQEGQELPLDCVGLVARSFVATAINTHFKCHGPEHWHFLRKKQSSTHTHRSIALTRSDLHEAVRRDTTTAWLDNVWVDLMRSGQIRTLALSRHVPSSDGKGAQHSTDRRTELAEEKSKFEVLLSGEVWLKVAPPMALPYHLKPPVVKT